MLMKVDATGRVKRRRREMTRSVVGSEWRPLTFGVTVNGEGEGEGEGGGRRQGPKVEMSAFRVPTTSDQTGRSRNEREGSRGKARGGMLKWQSQWRCIFTGFRRCRELRYSGWEKGKQAWARS